MLAISLALAPIADAHHGPPYASGTQHDFGEMVDYPLVFPVDADIDFSDWFYSPRCCDPGEIHHAIDMMAPKMTPVLAAASGTVKYVNWSRQTGQGPPSASCCTLAIDHDDGWESWYIHLNNDNYPTDDGQGWGIAPGIDVGVHVVAGQLIGWVGDSGNAENTGSHLHYELRDPENIIVNPYQALKDAQENGSTPRCGGLPVTLTATPGEPLFGTDGDDVILGTMLDDEIYAGGGNDVVCGLDGRDYIEGGPGNDTIFGGDDRDTVKGGSGADYIVGGKGSDRLKGNSGRDTIVSDRGHNKIKGGGGKDLVDYSDRAASIELDLAVGREGSKEVVLSIERVIGSPFDDILAGSEGNERLDGGDGDDTIFGGGGSDKLLGRAGSDHLYGDVGDDDIAGGADVDTADGGEGIDACTAETQSACEA